LRVLTRLSRNCEGETLMAEKFDWQSLKKLFTQADLGEIVKNMPLEDVERATCLALIQIAIKLEKINDTLGRILDILKEA